MPISAPKPCTVCATLVHDGTVRCSAHKLPTWVKRPEVKRTTGRQLQRQRAALFSREPLCRECSKVGRVSEAVIRDHIVPLAEGGSDDDDNVQPLCLACSDRKSAAERQRGRGRGGRKLCSPSTGNRSRSRIFARMSFGTFFPGE